MDYENSAYRGLGGWLIAVALRLFATLIHGGIILFNGISTGFSADIRTILTTLGSERYNPSLASFIMYQHVAMTIRLLLAIALLILFFLRKRCFPMVAIAGYAISTVLVGIDLFLVRGITGSDELFRVVMSDLLRAVIVCLIWIPYLLVSRRVKATFTE